MIECSSRGLSLVTAAAVVVGLVMGLLAGVVWHEPIRTAFGSDKASPMIGGVKQLWTCGMHPQVIREEPGTCPICHMALEPVKMDSPATAADPPAADHGGHVSAAVQIDPAIVQNMGVRTAKVTHGPLQREVWSVAIVTQPQSRLHDINLRVGGWIEKLHAHTQGMSIRKGEPLFELYSPDVLVAIEELISARRNVDTSGSDAARVMYNAAVRKLQLWGLADEEVRKLAHLDTPPRTITFVSPMTAEVSEKMVVEGAAVMMGDRVMQLADRSTVWLDAQVFAQDLPFIAIDQTVTATVESFPSREFNGKIIFIHPNVEAMTRTALVRIELDNADLLLRPGMYATIRTNARIDPHATLVPDEAVIDTGTRQVVFLSLGGGKFEPRTVKIGLTNADGTVQVLEGLSPGDTVVTSGQFLLDSESRMREAIAKFLSQDGATTPPPAHQH